MNVRYAGPSVPAIVYRKLVLRTSAVENGDGWSSLIGALVRCLLDRPLMDIDFKRDVI